MWWKRREICLGLLLVVPVFSAPVLLGQSTVPDSEQISAARDKFRQTEKQFELPPLPSGPQSQAPIDQIPASPAKVSYQGGLLTISAQNSVLGEILRDVRRLTGASIEVPQGPGENKRVVAHLGPGAPRDVLAGLFDGLSFNYVMVGSASDPTIVSTVILTVKPSPTEESQPVPQAFNQPVVPAPAVEQAEQQAEQTEQPEIISAEDGKAAAASWFTHQAKQNEEDNPEGAKQPTPEQLQEILDRQQQLASGGANPAPPPQTPQQ